MRWILAFCMMATCGHVCAETHVGFEAVIDREWNCVRIELLYAGSHAKTAGLRSGDVVVAIDKVLVRHPKTVRRYCERKKPGQFVFVTVKRNGEHEEIQVVLGEGDELRKSGLSEQ